MALAVIEGGVSQAQAALQFAVTAKVVTRWVERYKAEDVPAWATARRGPGTVRMRPVKLRRPDRCAAARQHLTGEHIARMVAVSPATVSRVLARAGLSRLKDLEPAEPVRRYEHDAPGDMIHINIKKLGRFDRIGHRIRPRLR